MKKEKFFFVKPLDVIICLVVAILALIIWLLPYFNRADDNMAVVTVGDREYFISLLENGEYVYANNGYSITVCVEDGAVCVSDTDCPDKVCKSIGKISRRGEVIICSPSEISVKITEGDGYDVVAY